MVPTASSVLGSSAVEPVYRPLDATCWGAMMGLILLMAARTQIRVDNSLALAEADIEVARKMGLLKANLTELHGLLEKPTSKLSGLKGENLSRATTLMYEINHLCVQIGYVYKHDGTAPPPAGSLPYSLGNPYRAGERVATTWADPVAAQATEARIVADNWAELQGIVGTGKNLVLMKYVGVLADQFVGYPFSNIPSSFTLADLMPPSPALKAMEEGGRTAVGTYTDPATGQVTVLWSAFQAAFSAERARLLTITNGYGTDIKKAYAGLDNWFSTNNTLDIGKANIPMVSLSGGVLLTDDATMLEGFSITIGADADAKNQLINKSTSAASNDVQQVNSLYDAAKGTLDQLGRAGKSSLNY